MNPLPERDLSRPAEQQGMFRKFDVQRLDGRHQDCAHFVMDLDCDPHAIAAIKAYAESCRETHPHLAADLESMVERLEKEKSNAGLHDVF